MITFKCYAIESHTERLRTSIWELKHAKAISYVTWKVI